MHTDPAAHLSTKDIPAAERLIFALDLPSVTEAKRMVDLLGDTVRFYKVGLQLAMTGAYFELIDWLAARDKKIFADLKLYDIPETVKLAVAQLTDRHITFLTIHAVDSLVKAAVPVKGPLKLLAVTLLTSLDQRDLDADLGVPCNLEQLVLSRAERALAIGCDGVISSGLDARALRARLGADFLIVNPGIRAAGDGLAHDQKRVATVRSAFQNGADYIVAGRLIRDAADPHAKAAEIQQEIAGLFGG
jgi:orotidine-5'-phosphate decarboxylase